MHHLKHKNVYRIALAVAVIAALMLIWLSLGVGIIGQDGDPANRLYFGVILVGVSGALLTRLKPLGMARTMLAMASVQTLIAAFAIIAKLGLPWSGPFELVLLNGFFVAAFLLSGWLFQRAAE